MRVSKTQVAGFVTIGAALGAFVALMFAPKTGAQNRKDLRKFSKRTANQLDHLQHEVRDQINGGVTEVVDAVKEYAEDGKKRFKKLIRTE
jgi:gas vesicle protein